MEGGLSNRDVPVSKLINLREQKLKDLENKNRELNPEQNPEQYLNEPEEDIIPRVQSQKNSKDQPKSIGPQ